MLEEGKILELAPVAFPEEIRRSHAAEYTV